MTYKEALERIANYEFDNRTFPGGGMYYATLFQEIANKALKDMAVLDEALQYDRPERSTNVDFDYCKLGSMGMVYDYEYENQINEPEDNDDTEIDA